MTEEKKIEKIALLFPGLGTHYPGMGIDLYRENMPVREVFDTARDVLWFYPKFPLLNRFYRKSKLDETVDAQRAVFVTNHALFQLFRERFPNLEYHVTAGHSIGQYNALIASGAATYEDTLKLVVEGTRSIDDVTSEIKGDLFLLVGKYDLDDAKRLLKDFESRKIYIALKNSPGGVVIGGLNEDLGYAKKELEGIGIKCSDLKIRGAYHTLHMKPAADKVKHLIENANIIPARVPLIGNASARAITRPRDIQEELYTQLFNLVQWQNSVRFAYQEFGITFFIVIGDDYHQSIGKTVKSTLTRIHAQEGPDYRITTIRNKISLEKAVEKLSRC
ncbi:MAG: acyltransferase domain-containing protein [Nanoarchaeota archaeon]